MESERVLKNFLESFVIEKLKTRSRSILNSIVKIVNYKRISFNNIEISLPTQPWKLGYFCSCHFL